VPGTLRVQAVRKGKTTVNESYEKKPRNDDEDEATLGFARVIRQVSANTNQFGGWGPKTRL
jgi:hypothetical protein